MIILIILKSKPLRNRVNESLKNQSSLIVEATNSQEAVNYLRNQAFDLVITEVDIGDVDGWRLSRLIRSGILVSSSELPILLVTENHSERIAETTARMFDINRVISYQELELVNDVVNEIIIGKGNLNHRKKLLVIEDTADTSALIKRMLKNQFDIHITDDGILGLEAYKKNDYDIVLLDIMMPGMSGDEVLDVIMKLNPKQVVIAMTAHGTIDLAELMLVKGATDYIQKPFKAEQLRKVCDIASKREDFLIANEQFTSKALALRSQEEKFQSLSKNHYRILDSLSSIVIEISATGRISFLNNAWFKYTGHLASSSIGQFFSNFIYSGSTVSKQFVQESFDALLSGINIQDTLEIQLVKENGEPFWCAVNISPHFNGNRELIGISGTIDDISARKQTEQRLQHVALHDTLTGIHNRYYFDNELKNFSNQAKRAHITHSLLYVDLDHFKIINDSQGHHQGDVVLKEVARLLLERTRESDLLCRIGGDEFAVLLTNTNVDNANKMALEICQVIADSSFTFDDKVYKVSCSIGISAIDGRSHSSEQYLQQADLAMFSAKETGRNRVNIYSDTDQTSESLKQNFAWVQKVQSAIVEDNIVLHFQPIIDVKTREVECYEALVRLMIDDKMIFPNDFIPSLEKTEDIHLLDRHVIDKALSVMHANSVLKKIAINLSAQAFSDDRLFSFIVDKLAEYQIEPSRVIFELTESASLTNITGTQRMVNKLNDHGCHFSIDDFGTGFSTFSYLKQIPADSVKIDGSFVKDMAKNSVDAVLVKAIHETALALGKTTIAEFVEDEETLHKLAELGVTYAQGYYISKPMNIEAVNSSVKKVTSVA